MLAKGHQERGIIRTYVLPLLSLFLGLFLVTVVVVWNARFTVASGEKSDDLAYYPYGYRIEQYYVGNTFRISFWSSHGMEFAYEQGQSSIEAVDQQWLKNDGAVYLELQIRDHDSGGGTDRARIIFDFHRGEVYTASDSRLWRHFDRGHTGDRFMSDSEFDAVLTRFKK
jgi:hypothetical protein